MVTKSELRQQLRAARLTLTPDEVASYSRQIIQNLRSAIDWDKVTTLHYFEPITALNEPNITPFIDELAAKGAIQLFTTRKLDGSWQIVNHDGLEPVVESTFDVILVPMLGYDPNNHHRIGYGGGYYDRLLASQPQAQRIGICFSIGFTTGLPYEAHDMSFNKLVTD